MARYIFDAKGKKREVKGHKHRFRKTPDNMKGLPQDLIGTDMADPDKVDTLDAPHVVEGIVEDYVEKQEAPEKKKKLRCAQPGEYVPLSQWEIDCARMRVIKVSVDRYIEEAKSGVTPNWGVKHLWFPENNVNHYELREGNPPGDAQRPKHMRRFRIEIDILNIPETIQKLLDEEQAQEGLVA
jgi:hypothetical protein